jgi:hypothetical protein
MNNLFGSTFNYKVVYIFQIYDKAHQGILKVGESTLKSNLPKDELIDNSEELNQSAKDRIRSYTNTIGVQENLLYTTLAINNKNKIFKDKEVHKVLKNSGIKKHDFHNDKNPEEWFETNVETVINAINAVKEGRKALNRTEVNDFWEEIEFRPEQIEAIEKTLKRFEITKKMLWNAKMRFGKTLSTLEVIKRMSKDKKFNLSKAIILTHRPVVDEGWFEDFTKIFHNDETFLYGSKRRTSINELKKSNQKFIYFASMQDLRGSERTGGIYLKNDEVFEIDWDLIVIDEAHEGIKTELGKKVLEELLKSDNNYNSKQLHLSGTPFNLLSDFESNDIYTWDYIMEQKAKSEWNINHSFEPNPYDDLPKLNIFTYNLDNYLPIYQDVADKAFNFREFFRVWTGETEKDGKELIDTSKIGKFMHENDVKKFLSLIAHESDNNYPFSKKEYRDNFRHSFWILPGVKEAKALKELMLKDEVFSMYDIVNVAGTGDNNGDEALELVHNKIGNHPEDTYTITLSCGKLTTGVTVKEWSAVLYLAGSFSTSASNYLQTIFRVQSPCNFGGKQKTDCYVFDFAPDRTLKMIAEAGNLSLHAGSTGSHEVMKQFLNFCPVISVSGSEMKPYNVSSMLQELKKAYVQRVVENGFDDVKIYNDNLYKLDENALKKFDALKGIIGSSKQTNKINDIDINKQGFSQETWDEIEKARKKKKQELTKEQKQLLEEIKERNKQKNDAISILRGISIRIPLLIYGAEINDDEDITIDNLSTIIDDVSWKEFMPKGVTKEMFNDFSKYYDNEIFIGAGHRIRNLAKHADTLNPIARAIQISEIFSTFRNPDKETVLTPWKTVNMHMGDTLGGYNFYDEKYIVSIEEPRLINNGDVTREVLFDSTSKILEMNSKTGLYPLYVTISLFKQKCLNTDSKKLTDELEKEIWYKTIQDNIFVVCKTKMAKAITKRTLIGYKDIKTNIINDENIIETLSNNFDKFKSEIFNPITWGRKGDEKMKFNAIVGNPPYQLMDGGNGASAKPVYNIFIEAAKKLKPDYISMISPSRWFAGGKGLDNFRYRMLNDKHISILHDYLSAAKCFPGVEIKGGVSYFLINNNYEGPCKVYTHTNDDQVSTMVRYLLEDGCDVFIRYNAAIEIRNKVVLKNFVSFSTLVQARKPFGIPTNDKDCSEKQDEFNNIKFYAQKTIGYINKNRITKNIEWKDKWKVLVSEAIGSGDTSTDRIKPIIAGPNSVSSETYILIGPFDNQKTAHNIAIYTQTAFFLYMLGLKKITQHTTSKVYDFVPLQDFSENSDIDWKKSICDIDKQLFKKYDLSESEIKEIVSTVDMKYQIEE